MSRAIFEVTGRRTAGGGTSILHVYALSDDSWSESGITWVNAPNLLGAADAKLTGVGTTATPVGHLTFDGTQSTAAIDLTDYLRRHGAGTDNGVLTLAIVREERFPGDADANVVELFTSESPTSPPRLTLYTDATV